MLKTITAAEAGLSEDQEAVLRRVLKSEPTVLFMCFYCCGSFDVEQAEAYPDDLVLECCEEAVCPECLAHGGPPCPECIQYHNEANIHFGLEECVPNEE